MDMDMEFVNTDHHPSYSLAVVIYYHYYCYIDVVNQTKDTLPQQTLNGLRIEAPFLESRTASQAMSWQNIII